MKIETYLPVFSGFYNTIFEPDFDYLTDEENTDKQNDDLIRGFDNSLYEEKVSKLLCAELQDQLKEFVTTINFQSLYSPKEYNFTNDSIDCEIELSEDNLKAIRDFIYANNEKYIEYLKGRFTSRSGFSSFYSNKFDMWREYTKEFTDYSDKSVYLGSVLDFICTINEITDNTLYEDINHMSGITELMFQC